MQLYNCMFEWGRVEWGCKGSDRSHQSTGSGRSARTVDAAVGAQGHVGEQGQWAQLSEHDIMWVARAVGAVVRGGRVLRARAVDAVAAIVKAQGRGRGTRAANAVVS